MNGRVHRNIPLEKTRLHQCQQVVVEVRTIYKNDQGLGSFKDDEQQRNTATVPRPIGSGDKGYILMGNRTKRDHGNDQNG